MKVLHSWIENIATGYRRYFHYSTANILFANIDKISHFSTLIFLKLFMNSKALNCKAFLGNSQHFCLSSIMTKKKEEDCY